MILNQAQSVANEIKSLLEPHCIRIEIAGSIRRLKPEVKDIEIVCIPKPYETGLFASGIATIINKWQKVKGELPCKYTQRILPQGIKADIFFANPDNWGLIFAVRTGSADYSHKVLASNWSRLGYKSINGMLTKDETITPVREEIDLFNLLGLKYIEPQFRNI